MSSKENEKGFTSLPQSAERPDIAFVLKASGVGLWELELSTNRVLWDERCRSFFGLSAGNSMSSEDVSAHFIRQNLGKVGENIFSGLDLNSHSYDQTFRITGIEDHKSRWIRFQGRSYLNEAGAPWRYAGIAQDVTGELVLNEQLAADESLLRSIIDQAPVAIGLFAGEDMVLQVQNQTFSEVVGKGTDTLGRPLLDIMPELKEQPFINLIRNVYDTSQPYQSYDSAVHIIRNGNDVNEFYNLNYVPLKDGQGKTFAVLGVAVEVTEQIVTRQQLEQKEFALRSAMDIAKMGMWEMDMLTGIVTYSETLKRLFEFDKDFIETAYIYNPILESDRSRLRDAVEKASQIASGGVLDEEYVIIPQYSKSPRMVRAHAKMYFDEDEQPIRMVGTMRDITEEKDLQAALEQLVQQRTEDLAVSNEELQAMNEELTAGNEELGEANSLLVHSNENLQTFAYVASHDLQEPLRKIQQFADLLRSRHIETDTQGIAYLERIQAAAKRMSTLISDLLNYSRISTHKQTGTSVALNGVLQDVLTILELSIQQAGAVIHVDTLPVIQGDAFQLRQLFQNLLSNAIKFQKPGVVPLITIGSIPIASSDLPANIFPIRPAELYCRIDVCDNGIGFDEKLIDRIFQVFQRLHGRNDYEGTGIGLAICEKVVTNHGGALTANSQPGQGSIFSIYFPVMPERRDPCAQ